MAIVYKHIRIDKNEPFYIGIGKSKSRAYSKKSRSKHWHSIVNKADYEVEIIKTGISWEDAKELEIELISKYGRNDLNEGTLVNHTDGGDGNNNQRFTAETRSKMSKSHLGKELTEKHKRNISKAKQGIPQSESHRLSNSLSHKGNIPTEETKRKISQALKGRIISENQKEKLSKINSEHIYEKYNKDGELIGTYESMYFALSSIGKTERSNCIYNHLLGYTNSAGGYIWKKVKKSEKVQNKT